ncbi:MAG: hypothetical protein PH343_10585, partial [Nitrospira sp.]|nr:hypothetical protein [Nitrospira sp.]
MKKNLLYGLFIFVLLQFIFFNPLPAYSFESPEHEELGNISFLVVLDYVEKNYNEQWKAAWKDDLLSRQMCDVYRMLPHAYKELKKKTIDSIPKPYPCTFGNGSANAARS